MKFDIEFDVEFAGVLATKIRITCHCHKKTRLHWMRAVHQHRAG